MSGSLSSHARVAGTRTTRSFSQQDADVANRGRRIRPAPHQLFRLRPRTITVYGPSAGVRTNGSLMVIRGRKRINRPTYASIEPSLLVARVSPKRALSDRVTR